MKLVRTCNDYRPVEPFSFTQSVVFGLLLLACSVGLGFAAGLLVGILQS